MHPSLEQLQKILKLEIGNHYPNTAVIGGLPKMLGFWEPNARRAGLDATLIDTLADRIRAYGEMPQTERATAVEAMLGLIQSAGSPAPAPTPPRAPKEAPFPKPTPPPTVERKPAQEKASQLASLPAPQPTPRPLLPKPVLQPTPLVEAPKAPSAAPGPSRPAAPPAQAKPSEHHPPHSRPSDVHGGEEPLDPRPRRTPGPRPLKAQTPLNTSVGLDAPLTVLNGVGPETAKKYEKLGLNTLRDLLLYFPRRYDDYSKMKTIHRLEYGEECSVLGTITEAQERRIKGGQATLFKVVLSDTTGQIEVSFFNQTWLKNQLTVGKQVVVAGRVDQYLGRRVLVPTEWEPLDRDLLHTGRIVPVYRLTQGITSHALRKLTAQVTQYWARKQADPLPADMVERNGLLTYGETLAQIHYPDSDTKLEEAQHRLAFDELLLLQLGVLRQRQEWQAAPGRPVKAEDGWFNGLLDSLPYRLTGAQTRALADIRTDLARTAPMNRLLQGDVGSGKTVVAAVTMALAVQAGAQAAIMAPTSILAEQHYRGLTSLLSSVIQHPSELRLLQGSTPASEKEDIYAGLKSGAVKVVIGTHALIEAPVEFANLGVVVIDEQHRFGVAQRAALRGKGGQANPHLLVMTATPIPRSLALTIYGDLDLSILDEMPPGRQPIKTHILHANERERGYAFIRHQIQQERQAFIIFPLVEESEKIDAKAAVEEHARLQKEVFREFKLGLLHGRLKPDEKDDVMARFHAGEFQILVSTSVVEVGVDVPNATVMMIEGANRFGLAQLHQFRGRVGRGEFASYCLLASDAPNPRADERLLAMEQSQDGFYLAEKDMELRGPGDFLGTRQAGFASVSMARLTDVKTIEKARREAHRIFDTDPSLLAPEHQTLSANLAQFWVAHEGAGDVS